MEVLREGDRMKKKLLSIISTALVLGVCLTSGLTAKAAGSFSPFFEGDVYEQPRLVDQADLLSDSEEQALLNKLNQISAKQGMDVVIVTVQDHTGSMQDFCDDFFTDHNYAWDGVIFMLSMEERDWHISTFGYGITAITDYGYNKLFEYVKEDLSANNYYSAFNTWADTTDEFITEAKNGTAYDTNHKADEGEKPFALVRNLIISLLAGLGIGGIRASSLKGQLKTVHQQVGAAQYTKENSLNVTVDREIYLYRNVTRTEKPQNSGGGSSTHTTSSGRTAGGGGGKF